MTNEDALALLRKVKRDWKRTGDTEAAHIEADAVLLTFLIYLGAPDVVDAYTAMSKDFWYG